MTKRRLHLSTRLSILLSIATTLAHGQGTLTAQQKADFATCSNIVALAGDININCSSLTPEQEKLLKKIPVLLNKIIVNQGDQKLIADKLDQMIDTLSHLSQPAPTTVVSAPNGIAVAGGTVFSPTVINQDTNPYKPETVYAPDGDKTTKSTSHGAAEYVEQNRALVLVYEKFGDFERQGDWNGLLKLSEDTRKSDPDWFTLDFTSGYANVRLCHTEEAKTQLDKFIKESEGAPDYKWLRDSALSILSPWRVQMNFGCPQKTDK
jgi:hypothetical protein